MSKKTNNIRKRKKISSSHSLTNCPSHLIIQVSKFINLSKIKSCGPKKFSLYKLLILDTKVKTFSGIRTRDFCVTDKYFAAKLLARSDNIINLTYLK